jgi:hypothetical protein
MTLYKNKTILRMIHFSNMTTESIYQTRKRIKKEITYASREADVERLRAVYAAHGREMVDSSFEPNNSDADGADVLVIMGVMQGVQQREDVKPYLDLLTVFYRELGPQRVDAHRTTTVIFGALVRSDVSYSRRDSTLEDHERWFESMCRVVVHLVEVCGLLIHDEEDNNVRKLIDYAVGLSAWASLFAFAPYIGGLPERPLERFIDTVRYLEQHRQWWSPSDYIMERLMRLTPDDELARIALAMSRYKDGPIRRHLQAETERRQNAARELALRTGSMMQRPSWSQAVMRETILGDMIMDLAFGRHTLIP